jgi:LPS-assembly protein
MSFSYTALIVTCLTSLGDSVFAQTTRPPFLTPAPPSPGPVLVQPNKHLKPIRANAPAPGDIKTVADTEEKDGSKYHLVGNAQVETAEMLLKADRIDYDEETGEARATGNVHFEHFTNGEKLQAERGEYNVDDETGKFYEVSGTSPAKIQSRPGVLTTSNPFYFQAKWAERQRDKYILHDGFITDCKMPNPWWILRGPTFDVIPEDRAVAYRSIFWLRRIPIFYAPAFYKSLRKNPRRSGFLTPNIGNSSRRGKMVGLGYYWAINRSYDLMYRNQYFTERGFAHNVDLRGKVNDRTDFDAMVYGVNDRGVKIGDQIQKQGGFLASFNGRSDLGHGWLARGEIHYLSSFQFRQNFTESFYEAIAAESRSTAFLTKHWSSFGMNLVFDRDEVFQITSNNEDHLIVRKLPEFEFVSRERQVSRRFLPIWFSLESSASLLHRDQPLFTTRQFVDRVDFAPRVMTAAYWKGFSLVPSFLVRETHYGSSLQDGVPIGQNVVRSSREFTADLTIPSIARVFKSPKWLGADKVKHVIEPHLSYRNINGIDDFNELVRFDEADIYSNTNELEISVTNRLYAKQKDGRVNEVLTWQVSQRRYFDPTFGGAVVPGQRNVLLSSADLTGYAFIDGPRNYSPVVSLLRYSYKIGMEWRADYDPLRGQIVNSGFTADYRQDKYFISLGHNQVRESDVLSPSSNQFRGLFGIGNDNRRGWNAGSSVYYDYRKKLLQYATTQITYNTDCCGFSVQYRRFAFGTRNENQFRVAFAVANIGTFGTLKRQERTF